MAILLTLDSLATSSRIFLIIRKNASRRWRALQDGDITLAVQPAMAPEKTTLISLPDC